MTQGAFMDQKDDEGGKLYEVLGRLTARHLIYTLAENPFAFWELVQRVEVLSDEGVYSDEEQAAIDEWEAMTPFERVWGKEAGTVGRTHVVGEDR